MPSYDLRGIKIARYNNNNGTVTYTDKQTIGDAISVDIQTKKAEGRLYCESALAEYMTKVTGGTISIGVKYIPINAQKLLFGARTESRTVSGQSIESLVFGGNDVPTPVGVAFYAPSMVDGVEKYTCIFIKRAIFGAPNKSYKTASDSISFNTDTTTGEFMPDAQLTKDITEQVVLSTEALAKAWVDNVLAGTSRALNTIAVLNPPTKVTYESGDALDLSGIIVGALYNDATSSDVTASCTFSPANGATLTDESSITITYVEGSVTKTSTQSITVS